MGTVEGDSGTNWKSQKAGGKITASTDRALAGPKHDAKGQYVASGCSCLFFVCVCSGMGWVGGRRRALMRESCFVLGIFEA